MTPDAPDTQLRAWLRGFPGRLYRRAEYDAVGRVLAGLHGPHLVQIGGATRLPVGLPRRRITRVGWGHTHPGADLLGEPAHLPFSTDSVDLLVLPHVLELHADPHQVLREAHRVLTPEGHIIITGFTPWSLFGVMRAVYRRRQLAPWQSHPLARGRVTDWLALLGYELVSGGGGLFEQRRMLSWRDLRRPLLAAQPAASLAAGLYVLVARKKVLWVRPVVSRWRPRRLVAVGLAEPSVRSAVREATR